MVAVGLEVLRKGSQVEARLRDAEQLEAARRAFYGTPPGRARAAFQSGDQVLQYALDVRGLDPIRS